MTPLSHLAIVVPVLNDGPALERLLAWRNETCPAAPLWVVDGGSGDDSREIARRNRACVLRARGGRGAQMNAGAAAAIGAGCDVLWFVHADVVPPEGSGEKILAAVEAGAGGGAFRRRFDHPSRWLRFTCWLADWRGRWPGWFLGDQGIFVTTEVFAAVGGYPEWPWFEDLEFSRRARRVARTVLLPATLLASGRRFVSAGAWRQSWRDLGLTCRYLQAGAPPAQRVERAIAGPQRGLASAERSGRP